MNRSGFVMGLAVALWHLIGQGILSAQLTPLDLTGFNRDVVVEVGI